MNDRAKYWFEMADDDLITAQALLKTRRYLWAGFMCNLAVEKSLKAVIAKTKAPPKIHDLVQLAKLSGLYPQMDDEQKKFLDLLLPLNIEARYPAYKSEMQKRMTFRRCVTIIKQTKELSRWIKEQF